MKRIIYITNLGNKKNINGQTEKAGEVLNMLNHMNDVKIILIDKSNPFSFLNILLLPFYGNSIFLTCLGINGLKFIARIPFITKEKIIIVAVGGWILDLINDSSSTKTKYLNDCTILTESKKIEQGLVSLNIKSKVFPNFRTYYKDWKGKNFSKGKAKIFKFIYIGRIIPEKGIEEIVKFSIFLSQNNFIHTISLFGPIHLNYNDKFFELLQKSVSVSYCGVLLDKSILYNQLRKSDFFLFPTTYSGECVPGSVIESLTVGTPVITNNWRFMDEIIESHVNGFITSFNDSNFLEILNFLIWSCSEKNYLSLSTNSIRFVKEYQSFEVANKILSKTINETIFTFKNN